MSADSLQAKQKGIGYCQSGDLLAYSTEDNEVNGCADECTTYISHDNDYYGVVEADSSSSFYFVENNEDDWDRWYNWDEEGDPRTAYGYSSVYLYGGEYYVEYDTM